MIVKSKIYYKDRRKADETGKTNEYKQKDDKIDQ